MTFSHSTRCFFFHRILIIISTGFTLSLTSSIPHYTCMEIKSPLINFLDSHLTVKKLIKIERVILGFTRLRYGSGPHHQGLVPYNNYVHTVHELAVIEKKLGKNIPKSAQVALSESLKNAIGQALAIASAYGVDEDLILYNRHMLSIIQRWSEQRKRMQTLLPYWLQLGEERLAKEVLTSFVRLDTFIDDLITFLKDMKCSCKKSNAAFKKSQAQA